MPDDALAEFPLILGSFSNNTTRAPFWTAEMAAMTPAAPENQQVVDDSSRFRDP
jgi:hypothetical protein